MKSFTQKQTSCLISKEGIEKVDYVLTAGKSLEKYILHFWFRDNYIPPYIILCV
jgi:hypothetical protein